MRTIKIAIILLLILIISIPAHAFHFKVVSMNTTAGNDYIDLGLYDTFGGYAGYNVNDPRNFTRNLKGFLPGSMVAGSFTDDQEPILNYIIGKKPDGASGHYKLAIYGQRLAIYGVEGIMKEQSNKTGDEFVFYIKGLIDIGQIRYVQIDYTPNKPVVITKIATSNDLIADITTAHKLN